MINLRASHVIITSHLEASLLPSARSSGKPSQLIARRSKLPPAILLPFRALAFPPALSALHSYRLEHSCTYLYDCVLFAVRNLFSGKITRTRLGFTLKRRLRNMPPHPGLEYIHARRPRQSASPQAAHIRRTIPAIPAQGYSGLHVLPTLTQPLKLCFHESST